MTAMTRWTGAGGDDTIYGGTETGDSGLDTANFTGNLADYIVTRTGPGVYTVEDSVLDRDGTDTVHEVETLHFDDVDLPLDAPILVFNSTGTLLLATFQANQLSQAVNFANGHTGANIIELRSSASPFTSAVWPATVTEAVTIKAVGGTATINAGANSGIAIAASAVLGIGDTVRLEGLNITGNGTIDTVGVVFSGVYEGPSDGAIEIVNTSVSGFGQNGVAIIGGGPGTERHHRRRQSRRPSARRRPRPSPDRAEAPPAPAARATSCSSNSPAQLRSRTSSSSAPPARSRDRPTTASRLPDMTSATTRSITQSAR